MPWHDDAKVRRRLPGAAAETAPQPVGQSPGHLLAERYIQLLSIFPRPMFGKMSLLVSF